MNYWYPLLTLILSLFILHYLFIVCLPQSKLFWKRVDYFWISLGVLGIISATFTLRKDFSLAQVPLQKTYLKNSYYLYLSELDRQAQKFNDNQANYYEAQDDLGQAIQFNEAGIFYDSLKKKSSKYEDDILRDSQYQLLDSIVTSLNDFIDKSKNEYISSESKHLILNLKYTKENADELSGIERQADRNTVDWILLFCTPYAFAFAIAIRITKVTAEVKELKT